MHALPAILFTIYLIVGIIRKKRFFTPGNLLVGLYASSNLIGLVLYDKSFLTHDYESILYYCLCISLCILPFGLIDMRASPKFENPWLRSKPALFLKCLGIVGTLSTLYFFYYYRSYSGLPIEVLRSEAVSTGIDYGPFGGIMHAISGVWLLALCCIIPCYRRGQHWTALLFGASLANVLYILCSAGRAGLSQWLMAATFISLSYYHPKERHYSRYFKTITAVFGVIILAIIIYIGRERGLYINIDSDADYGSGTYAGSVLSFFDYFGQSFKNFGDFWQMRPYQIYWGKFQFSPIWKILYYTGYSQETLNVNQELISLYANEHMFAGVFCTFLRDNIMDFGAAGCLLVCCLFCGVSTYSLYHYQKSGEIQYYISSCYLGCLPLIGIFFSPLSGNSGVIMLACIPISAMVFSVRREVPLKGVGRPRLEPLS